MSRTLVVASLLAVIALAGCVPSLHPFYTTADLVLEPKILGVWREPDSAATWSITRAEEEGAGAYRVVHFDADKKRGQFIAHLAKVDGKLFLDLAPDEPPLDKVSNFYKAHLLPVHTVVYIQQVEPTLRATMLDPEWMEDSLKANPAAIKHEIVDGGVLLTASTKDLQQFYLKHIATEGAFGEAMELTKSQ